MITVFVPPCSLVSYSTVTTIFVIISILCSESHAIMISQLISSCTRVKPNKQRVVRRLVSNCKITVLGVLAAITFCLNFRSQLTRNLCQLMNLLVPKPKLSSDVTKSFLILVPTPVESNKAIKALVKDCPPSTINLHVTEHLKTGFVCWVYCVHAILFETGVQQFGTVSGCKN